MDVVRKINLLEDRARRLETDYSEIVIKYGALEAELKAAKASIQNHLEQRCKLQGELLDSERKMSRMNQALLEFRGGAALPQVAVVRCCS